MVRNDAELMELLRRLDDPRSARWPRDFDADAAAAPFDRLRSRLEAAFEVGCPVELGADARDAGGYGDTGEYGRIEVPAEAAGCGTRIVVAVSNFGPLAMVAADDPGTFLGTADAEAQDELDPADLAKALRSLAAAGYTAVPEELLNSRYDGATNLTWSGNDRPTWWDRYFGSS